MADSKDGRPFAKSYESGGNSRRQAWDMVRNTNGSAKSGENRNLLSHFQKPERPSNQDQLEREDGKHKENDLGRAFDPVRRRHDTTESARKSMESWRREHNIKGRTDKRSRSNSAEYARNNSVEETNLRKALIQRRDEAAERSSSRGR